MLQEVEAGRNERKDQFDKFELAYLASDFGNGHSNFNTITNSLTTFYFMVFFKSHLNYLDLRQQFFFLSDCSASFERLCVIQCSTG